MCTKSIDRIQCLYLDNSEDRPPFFAGESDSTPKERTDTHPVHSAVARSASNVSTVSSASKSSDLSSSGHQSSISSVSTSPTVPAQVEMVHFNYGYDLPCEFGFVGCEMRFYQAQVEAWISHSESHFFNFPPPPKAICVFCDDVFESHGNNGLNWRERMLHILDHLENLQPGESMRPDFWVIEYMWEKQLISPKDYEDAKEYTERPHCDNLVSLDWETPDMVMRKERNSQESHDLRSERRQMRREAAEGVTHPHSRPRKSHKPRIVLQGSGERGESLKSASH